MCQLVIDRINIMRSQEQKHYNQCSDYLDVIYKESTNKIDRNCRSKICKWYYQFVDYTLLQRETAVTAMNILDRFLSSGSVRAREAITNRKEYQLAAMTTLYMSIKLLESCAINTSHLNRLSKRQYAKTEFAKMEIDISFSLNWFLNCPTPLSFLEYFMRTLSFNADGKCNIKTKIKKYSKYLVERSVEDYEFLMDKPSIVALAAIFISTKKNCDLQNAKQHKLFAKLISSVEAWCFRFKYHQSNFDNVVNRMDKLQQLEPSILNDFHNAATAFLHPRLETCKGFFDTPTQSDKHPSDDESSLIEQNETLTKKRRYEQQIFKTEFLTPPTVQSSWLQNSYRKQKEAKTKKIKPFIRFSASNMNVPVLYNIE